MVLHDGPVRIGHPFNRTLLDSVSAPDAAVVLVSPTAGTGIRLSPLEACLLLALTSDDPVTDAAERLARLGLQLSEGGRPVADPAVARSAIASIVPAFRSGKMPKLISLGIAEPAV